MYYFKYNINLLMIVNFVPRGRLGNAIFRYMACFIICKYYNGTYSINNNSGLNVTDELFNNISNNILQKEIINLNNVNSINMIDFYQHDTIFLLHKKEIIEFINIHPDHYILTDGINAGDRNCQKFFMKNIITTPGEFVKKYKIVLHLRLEDFVENNNLIKKERILLLLEKLIKNKTIDNQLVIVLNKPKKIEELNYINSINQLLKNNNIEIILESNDVLTDYYILKEAEILISSNSTLCWCASFFSENLKELYFPEYKQTSNQTFKRPIENTIYY